MKHSDIATLMEGSGPAIFGLVSKMTRPLIERAAELEKRLADMLAAPPGIDAVVARLEAAEKRVAELETAPADIDLDAIVGAAIEKAMAQSDATSTIAKLASDVDEVRDLVMGLPGPDGLAAMIDKAVGAKVATIPPATPGKDADPAAVRAMVVEEVAKTVPTAEAVVALIPAPQPGKDADPEVTAALVATEVQKAVAAIPPAAPGKDADPEAVRATVTEEVAKALEAEPKPENGKDATPEQIAAAVEKVLASWQRPKDGDSVTLEQVRPLVDESVAKAVGAVPVAKDGVGLAGVLKDHEGCLVFTLTNGAVVKIARVDGEPGKDGLGIEDLEMVDDQTTVTFRFSRGDLVKEFVVPKPTLADFFKYGWKEGTEYKRGDVVMWAGQPWLAMADTAARPETNKDWTMLAKKARDGKDLTPIETKAPAPVKLR